MFAPMHEVGLPEIGRIPYIRRDWPPL